MEQVNYGSKLQKEIAKYCQTLLAYDAMFYSIRYSS